LVTGGAGYIGSTVTTLLFECGHEVTVLDDLSSGHEEAVPDGVTFVRGSVQDAAEEVLAALSYDGVLHFAGFIRVAESVAEPEKYWNNNVVATVKLLEAMHRHGVPRLVFPPPARYTVTRLSCRSPSRRRLPRSTRTRPPRPQST
jgi:UDP-glucose 4-epimerase